MKKNQVKKTLMKAFIWAMYIVCLPLLVLFTLVVWIGASISSKRSYGEFDFMFNIKALFDGYHMGHKYNMANVDAIFDDKPFEDLNWYLE